MFLVAVLGLIAVLVILDYVFKLQKRKLIVNIPGPAIYPLIGNLLFLTQRKSEGEIETQRRRVFLDVLFQSTINGKPLSDSDIQEEVDIFIFAGHDTVASATSFCLYHISRNAHVQAKLYDEIHRVFDGGLESVSLTKLNELKYMELVIEESLRLSPPASLIARTVSEDIVINDQTISAGTGVLIPISAIHKNPEIFPDPETFLPERHLSENIMDKALYTSACLPFSAGPRNCIGHKFAILAMKCMIYKVLNSYELLAVGKEPKLEMKLILKTQNGVQAGWESRK